MMNAPAATYYSVDLPQLRFSWILPQSLPDCLTIDTEITAVLRLSIYYYSGHPSPC
jgi:hypothetical protein